MIRHRDQTLDDGDEHETLQGHALVVGGTGMLRGVSLELLAQFSVVSVIARSLTRLEPLREAAGGDRINPLRLDWHDIRAVRVAIDDAIDAHGPISLVVCWCHATAVRTPPAIAEYVADSSDPCRFVHVLGSGSPRSSRVRREWQETLEAMPGLRYQVVQLGCERIGALLRWLEHDVICRGVMHAIESGAPHVLVGDPIP
jgi:NAD(P)-dependent dehydrogenase (short-subunit alcohol dehydrogenase family)